ncbi:MAG: tol-pal system YbgF family protein [Candidatus Tectimicrobiota bacterium]
MQEGEYFRAITEFRRFLFFYPEDHRAPMIHFRIGLALYRGQSYAEAAKVFSTVANRYGDSLYGQHAWLWLGESLLRQGLYSEAERLYTRLAQHFAGSSIGQQALYTQGWLLLYRRHWHEASVHFGHIAPSSPFYVQAQSLVHDALQGTRLPEKSPFVAGLLSALLPGSGQLYNGRRGDALLAFFLNGLFIAGILEAMQHHKYTVAGILSFFEIAWYSGNVYGAVNGAYKTNQHTTRNFLQNLENRYQPALPEMRQSRLLGIKFSLGF